jgi:hypothetical protein
MTDDRHHPLPPLHQRYDRREVRATGTESGVMPRG